MYLTDFLKKLGNKQKGMEGVYQEGYYSIGGLLTGMIVADLWDKWNLPGNKKKLGQAFLSGQPIKDSGYDEDKLYMNMIAGLVISLELLGIKGAASSGAGMLIGFNYVNSSKSGSYIGGLPSP